MSQKKIFNLFEVSNLRFSLGFVAWYLGFFLMVPQVFSYNLALDCHVSQSCVVYVDSAVALGGDGSLEKPFKTITSAVNFIKNPINPDFNTIAIATGTYLAGVGQDREAFPWSFDGLTKEVHFKGGYGDHFQAFDPHKFPTIVVASEAQNIANFTDMAGSVRGLEFSGVLGAATSAIQIRNTGSTSFHFDLDHNVFRTNTTSHGIPALDVKISGSNTATVSESLFYGNEDVLGNVAQFIGQITVVNNHFYGNKTRKILYCSNGAVVYNNYLLGNTANVVVSLGGDCTFVHNTVARNDINMANGNAVLTMANSGNHAVNNLITHNPNSGLPTFTHLNGDQSLFEYNALYLNGGDPKYLRDGNISCDPFYPTVTGSQPDYVKLGAGSMCIDAGKDLGSNFRDYYGTERPVDGNGNGFSAPDPGAFEAPFRPLPPEKRCADFLDVLKDDVHCPALVYVKNAGIFRGYPDGTFRSWSVINRAETAKVVLLGFGKKIVADDGTNQGFRDVVIGAWYMPYLATAKGLGMVVGYPDLTVKPGEQINRVELLKVFFTASGKDLSGISISEPPYTDTLLTASTSWYLPYVQYAKEYALVDADNDGNFHPGEGMKRGDVAELFYRYHKAGLDQ